MNTRSRPILLVCLPLVIILGILLLGCAPCCCWPGGMGDLKDLNDLKDLKDGNSASVSGTAVITTNSGEEPVSKVTVTMTADADQSAKYTTTTNSSGYFIFNNVTPGSYFVRIAGGDLGWTDNITVKRGYPLNLGTIQLHGTLPPPNTDSEKYPVTPENVIRAYYEAINEGDYSKAQNYVSGQLSETELDMLRGQYEPYVKNIQVVSIERRESMDYNNRQIYFVTFSAEYIKHYEAGNGDLQRMHSLQKINGKWMIVDIGTG